MKRAQSMTIVLAAFLSGVLLTPVRAFAVASELTSSLANSMASETSGLLVEEVLAQAEDPKRYDWRRTPLQLELSYSNVYEANIFESRSFGFGVARSFGSAWIMRGAFRRTQTMETTSSRQMALTIYSQAGLPSHYEVLAGVGYTLLDGRSATALSPTATDIGHSLTALLGVQYNIFDNRDPAPISVMRALYYNWVAETGLRFQVFLPNSFGASIEWAFVVPVSGQDPELSSWQRFGGNISWSFGM